MSKSKTKQYLYLYYVDWVSIIVRTGFEQMNDSLDRIKFYVCLPTSIKPTFLKLCVCVCVCVCVCARLCLFGGKIICSVTMFASCFACLSFIV